MVQTIARSKPGSITAQRVAVAVCAVFSFCALGFTAPTDGATKLVAKAADARPSLRIIAFGSSSTQGVGASSPAGAYPAQLQSILAHAMPKGRVVEVLNRGIGGEDVDDMMLRLQADVIAPKPDVVIWQTGSNDPLRHVPIERFETETLAGVKAMQEAGAEVILMEPQWCPMLEKSGNAELFRSAIRRVAQQLKVSVINRADLMHKWVAEGRMTKTQMLAPDGLHMTDSGYAQLARDIAPQVLKAAAIDSSTPVALQVR
jgi:acyl-CoA thioesterase-1